MVISLRWQKPGVTIALTIIWMAIQEGAGGLAFGYGILWYATLFALLTLGRWLLDPGSLQFQALLGVALGLAHFLLLYLMLVLLLLTGLILYRGIVPWLFRTLCVLVPSVLPLFWFVLKDYQKRRILAFLDPATDPLGSGYHILQSEIAVGSGRLFGKGFLAGTQSQLRFLPEKHTDFAVAVFGEEWGFFGMDDVPVDAVLKFEGEMIEFLRNSKADVLNGIAEKKVLDDDLEGKLKAAIEEFKKGFRA